MLSPELLQRLREAKARNDAERHDRQDSEHAPILYLKQGTNLVRPQLDSEENLIRNFTHHSVKTDDGHYSCLCSGVGESCPVCHRYEALKKSFPNWAMHYKFKSRENTMLYGTIFESTSDTPCLQLGVPMLIIADYRLGDRLSDLIRKLSDEEARKFLSPDVPYVPLELKLLKRSYGRGTTLTLDLSRGDKVVTDPLPKRLPPMSQCIYKIGERPDPKKQANLIEAMEKAFEEYRNRVTVLEPFQTADFTDAPPASGASQQPPQPAVSEQMPNSVQEIPQKECFGQHPHPSKTTAECLLCDFEEKCGEKTRSSR